MSGAVSTLSTTVGMPTVPVAQARLMSMRRTLAVWAAASIGGWALVLLALLPLL